MKVKIVPATKDVIKAIALSPLEVWKVIFIPAAVGLITGNRKTSILKAFTYLSRITPSRALCRYQLYNDSSWQPELARRGFKPQAHNKTPSSKSPPSFSRKLWVASTGWPKATESPSFHSELQLRLSTVGRNATERICSSVLSYSLRLWLKTNSKHEMSDTTDSRKNAFNTSAPEICPIHAANRYMQ